MGKGEGLNAKLMEERRDLYAGLMKWAGLICHLDRGGAGAYVPGNGKRKEICLPGLFDGVRRGMRRLGVGNIQAIRGRGYLPT